MKFITSLLLLMASLSVFADCSVYSDPQKAVQYFSQVGQEAWMSKYMQCLQKGQLQALDMSSYQKLLQQMQSKQASQRKIQNQYDNSTTATYQNNDHSTLESYSSGSAVSPRVSATNYEEKNSKSEIIKNIKTKDGRNCISIEIISSEPINHNKVNKYNTTFEITNICSETLTVEIEDSGVASCVTRVAKGSRIEKSCWTISQGKKTTYNWSYNPYW